MADKRIKDLGTTITAFRTGDVIPVDGPSGTAKMPYADLLKVTAENAEGEYSKNDGFILHDILNDYGKYEINPYKFGHTQATNYTEITYSGNTITFKRKGYTDYVSQEVSFLEDGKEYSLNLTYTNPINSDLFVTFSETITGGSIYSVKLLKNTTDSVIAYKFTKTSQVKYIRVVIGDPLAVGESFSITDMMIVGAGVYADVQANKESMGEVYRLNDSVFNEKVVEFPFVVSSANNATVAVEDGVMTITKSGIYSAYVYKDISYLENGKTYTLEFNYNNPTNGDIWLTFSATYNGASAFGAKLLKETTNGEWSLEFTKTSAVSVIRFSSVDFPNYGDSFSVSDMKFVGKEGLVENVSSLETALCPKNLGHVMNSKIPYYMLNSYGLLGVKDGTICERYNGDEVVLNPVIREDFPDPTFIKIDGYYYAIKTGFPCKIMRSTDFVNWEDFSQVFPDDFDLSIFQNYKNMWAPDVNIINGKVVVYVAVHQTAGEDYEQTIAMEASEITNPTSFVYKGVVIPDANNGGMVNAIDPDYYSENGNQYIVAGSFRGIYMFSMSDYLTIIPETKHRIANGEGAYIFKYGDYYYLFTSDGDYSNYTYHVNIARATSVEGPYLNKNGQNVDYYLSTTILSSSDGDDIYGPGHNGEILTDNEGKMYMMFHAHIKDGFPNNAYRAALIMRIVEGPDGWLAFADKDGNVVTKPTPITSVPKV